MAAQPLSGSVTWSRSELTSLLLKAGRGVGIPLAHAEDLARAVGRYGDRWAFAQALSALRSPWPELDATADGDRLTFHQAWAAQAMPHVLEALRSGFTWVHCYGVDHPALIPCYLFGEPVRMEKVRAQGDGGGSNHWFFRPSRARNVIPKALRGQATADIFPETITGLEALAAQTYVPATDTSRGGAGQGADQD